MELSPSKTALATAYLRAAHQRVDGDALIFKDPIALKLLEPNIDTSLEEQRERLMAPLAKELRAHVVLRSRYTEDKLNEAVNRGISQYVILGAGFDTLAYRQTEQLKSLSIIEIDHPETQKLKRAKLESAGIEIPENVKLVSVDFEKESIEEIFNRSEFDKSKPTFFSWLGVTMYLTPQAIMGTLKAMASFAKDSEIVLTFLQPSDDGQSYQSQLSALVKQVGEPFVSYFSSDEIQVVLQSAGFAQTEVLSVSQANQYFLGGQTVLGNPRRESLVFAVH
jgi:methyltransferase (TIGR00027 family)